MANAADYDNMKIKLLFFARARELAGTTEAEAYVPEGDAEGGQALHVKLLPDRCRNLPWAL